MWIYPARLGILILEGLQSITPYPPPLLGRRAVIVILRSGSRRPGCKSFLFFDVPVLTIGSTAELLVGCKRSICPTLVK